MEERQVTVDGRPTAAAAVPRDGDAEPDRAWRARTRSPEAQLDRFLVKTRVGYPDHEAEVRVLVGEHSGAGVDDVRQVSEPDEIASLVRAARSIHVAPAVFDYMVRLASHTRQMPQLRLGRKPARRPGLLRTSRVYAALRRTSLRRARRRADSPEPVLAHRHPDVAVVRSVGWTAAEAVAGGHRVRACTADRPAPVTLRAAGLLAGGCALAVSGWFTGWPELTALGAAAVVLVRSRPGRRWPHRAVQLAMTRRRCESCAGRRQPCG